MKSRDQPEGGQIPLTEKEYYAIRELFGAVSALEKYAGILERRAKINPGTWRDLRMMQEKAKGVLHGLLITIPIEKLRMIQKELPYIRVSVDVVKHKEPRRKNDEYTYVPTEAMETIMQEAIDWRCFACDNEGQDIWKCPLRKALEATYPFKLPGDNMKNCKFSGLNLGEEKD